MTTATFDMLLVEDNPGDARLLTEALKEVPGLGCTIHQSRTLEDAVGAMIDREFDVVIADLSLPDSAGLSTFLRLQTASPEVPVVVLTGLDDRRVALQAVRAGAQDFLVKGSVEPEAMASALRYAVERHQVMGELKKLSFVDDLTQLYNRRGFFTFGGQLLELLDRREQRAVLVFADLDDLKVINDQHGHGMGDMALRGAADALKAALRGSDVVARIGGDEFAALALDASEQDVRAMTARLHMILEEWRGTHDLPFDVHMTTGSVAYGVGGYDSSLSDLLSRADALMYERKKSRKRERLDATDRLGDFPAGLSLSPSP
jgi:diguanylate cyclase (GGDEF)-like protein